MSKADKRAQKEARKAAKAEKAAFDAAQGAADAKGSLDAALMAAAAYRRPGSEPHRSAFVIPLPPPGVLPDGAKTLAMDSYIGSVYDYAGSDNPLLGEGLGFMGFPYLSELAQRPEYRRGAETIARESTRKWITIKSSGKKDKGAAIKRIELRMKKLRVRERYKRASELDGFHGRAHIFLDYGVPDADLELPMVPKAMGKRKLKGIKVIEATWAYPAEYNARNPLDDTFFKPTQWYVNQTKIHASRLHTLIAREVPDILKPAYMFAGISLNQLAKPYVDNFLRTRQSVSDLVSAFSVMVLENDMGNLLQGGITAQALQRAQLFVMNRDNMGLYLVNKGKEELKNVSAPLGGLDHLQAQAQEQLCAVYGAPLPILLGLTPSGLNATNEGEIRIWYDFVSSYQENFYQDSLQMTFEAVQQDELGVIDPDLYFEFEPLWQMDEAAKASIRKTIADTHAIYLENSVVAAEEVREAVAEEENSIYSAVNLSGPPPDPPEAPEEGEPSASGDPAKGAIGGSGV